MVRAQSPFKARRTNQRCNKYWSTVPVIDWNGKSRHWCCSDNVFWRIRGEIVAIIALRRHIFFDVRARNSNSRMSYFLCSTNWWFRIWRSVFVVNLKCVVCSVGVEESAVSFGDWIEFIVVELHWISCFGISYAVPEWFCKFKMRDWFHFLCCKT